MCGTIANAVVIPCTAAVIAWNISCRSCVRTVIATTTTAPMTAPAPIDAEITVDMPRRYRFTIPASPPTKAQSATALKPLKPTTKKPITPAATVAVITTRTRYR